MELGLSGRVAIITGAARGIGRAEAWALAREGAKVVVSYKTSHIQAEELLRDIHASGGEAITVQADVSRTDDVRRMVQAALDSFGRIDILVNNASLTGADYAGPGREIVNLPETEWDAMLDVNLKGTFLCTKYVAPVMISQGWGRIINTSSIVGRMGGGPGSSHYAAAKAGVIGFTKAASKELAPFGITVNAIVPGFINTETLQRSITPESKALAIRQTPVGRFGEPGEVGALVAFLASDKAGFITGAIMDINGGRIEYSRE